MKRINRSTLLAGLIGFGTLTLISLLIFIIYILDHRAGRPGGATSSSAALTALSLVSLLVYAAAAYLAVRWSRHSDLTATSLLEPPNRFQPAQLMLAGALAALTASVLGTAADMILRIASRLLVVQLGNLIIPNSTDLLSSLIAGTLAIHGPRCIDLAVAALVVGAFVGWVVGRKRPVTSLSKTSGDDRMSR